MSSEVAQEILPWHQEPWALLTSAKENRRLHHALLLTGPEGLGKWQFAQHYAQALLCRTPDGSGRACGDCHDCRLFRAGSHPDLQLVEPDESSKSGDIRIDDIREMTDKEMLTSQSGGYKVILIQPADRMTTAAANSLLKTLEEPTAQTILLLVSSQPQRLPATIRSRCQQIRFVIPAEDVAIKWLTPRIGTADPHTLLGLAGGAPLAALALNEPEVLKERIDQLNEFLAVADGRVDLVEVAGRWATLDMMRTLTWVSGWLTDIVKLQSVDECPQLFNPDQRAALHTTAKRLESKVVFRLLDRVVEARRLAGSTLNPQLMLEELLIRWADCFEKKL